MERSKTNVFRAENQIRVGLQEHSLSGTLQESQQV